MSGQQIKQQLWQAVCTSKTCHLLVISWLLLKTAVSSYWICSAGLQQQRLSNCTCRTFAIRQHIK